MYDYSIDFLFMKDIIDQRIEFAKERIFNNIPARVISFNAKEQTVDVQPVMYETYPDGLSQVFPLISNVPAIFPSSGESGLTFPVNSGDYCLLHFCARDFDNWWQNNTIPAPCTTARKLAYNDAVVQLGLQSKEGSLQASTENVELFLKSSGNVVAKISLMPDGKIRIENEQEELISLLSELIDTLANNTVTTIYGASIMNSKPQLQALKQRLDTLKG